MNKSALFSVFLIVCVMVGFISNKNESTVYADDISDFNSIKVQSSIPPVSETIEENMSEVIQTPSLLYVGEGQQYLSVNEAVYYANEGDTVFIKEGTYSECIKISKNNITVEGENVDTTCIENDFGNVAIDIHGAKGVTIKNLSIKSTKSCIDIQNAGDCSIIECKIEAGLYGINADSKSGQVFIKDCDISGIGKGYGIKSSSKILSIINCDIYNNQNGIFVPSGTEVLVKQNRIHNHINVGCKLENVSKLACTNNNISSNKIGIDWDVTSEHIKTSGEILNNELFFNRNIGIVITDLCNIKIMNNHLYIHNDQNNWNDGIKIWLRSNSNTITNNIVSNYRYAVILDYYSSNNNIYWNDFICSEAIDNSKDQSNSWNMDSKGNYWSGYNGEDKNEDGIGDIPYPIKANLSATNPQDNYPLMKKQYNTTDPTITPIATSTPLPSSTPSYTPISTPTLPSTSSYTPTSTPTPSSTSSYTPTSTPTPSSTPSYTPTSTPTPSSTPSYTPTSTPTPSSTSSYTPTSTPTPSSTTISSTKTPTKSPNKPPRKNQENTIELPEVEIPAVATTKTPSPVETVTPHTNTPVPQEPVTVSNLSDINNHWAKDYINFVVSKGLMVGKEDGVFAPDDYATRAECSKVITTLLGKVSNDIDLSDLSDVSKKDWFYIYVYSAYKEKIMIGNPDGTFSPNTPVSRQDLAVIFSKILVGYYNFNPVKATSDGNDLDVIELNGMIELPFDDADTISGYAIDGVATSSNYGLFSGKPGNLFDPNAKTTRAELATILYKLIVKYGMYES